MRLQHLSTTCSILAVTIAAIAVPASGAIVHYTNQEEWEAANAGHTFIDFQGFPGGTNITDQYAPLGVSFVGGSEWVSNNWSKFPIDGWGLTGGFQGATPLIITAQFDAPRTAIGVNFLSGMQFTLFLGDAMIGTSATFVQFDTGNFGGIISTLPFDKVTFKNPASGGSDIDNLFFGAAIPAPASLVLFALLGMSAARRRRP
jgi:hypothetical protein